MVSSEAIGQRRLRFRPCLKLGLARERVGGWARGAVQRGSICASRGASQSSRKKTPSTDRPFDLFPALTAEVFPGGGQGSTQITNFPPITGDHRK